MGEESNELARIERALEKYGRGVHLTGSLADKVEQLLDARRRQLDMAQSMAEVAARDRDVYYANLAKFRPEQVVSRAKVVAKGRGGTASIGDFVEALRQIVLENWDGIEPPSPDADIFDVYVRDNVYSLLLACEKLGVADNGDWFTALREWLENELGAQDDGNEDSDALVGEIKQAVLRTEDTTSGQKASGGGE